MIKYTKKQQKELEKNPYTYKVTENKLFFTKEFKKVFWIKYNAGMSPRAIIKELGYDSTQIKNYRKISNYDEIMINK